MMINKTWKRTVASISLGLCVCIAIDPVVRAQVVPPKSVRDQRDEKLVSLSFRDAPIQVILDHYSEITGRTMIQSPGIPSVLLNLKGREKLTESEFLVALESVLAMNNIALVPMGEKFMKVVPSAELGTHGRGIRRHNEMTAEDQVNPASDTLQSRIIELKHLELSEILPILEGIKHSYAKIQPLERANGMLINETASNLERMLEIIDFLDVPIESKVETRIYELAHADAGQVASRLNELIQQAQSEQDQATSRRRSRNIRRVARAGQRSDQTSQNRQPTTTQSEVELAARGIVQGEVKIVSDERTNILIVISRPENFTFFDRIVTILDKSIEPNLTLEVVALEFGDAADIAGILNDFVGAATADAQSRQGRSGSNVDGQADSAGNRATALQEFVRSRRQARQRAAGSSAQGEGAIDEIGQLSENTRILSDQRTNSLLLMGRRQDIVALKQVIKELDVMLAQVLIEAVILEVNLNDNVETGIDWLQRSFTVSNDETVGPGGGLTVSQPVLGFGGGQQLTGSTFTDGSQINRDNAANLLAPGALTYYATFFDLNLDAVIRLASSESDAHILSTPVIVTTDNTEASILVGESRPVVTSTSTTAGGVARNTFQYQEIGISLDVTPRINPQNFVVMEVTQTADNVGGFEVIDGNNVPIITRRELQAQIAVEDRATIVLGGLVSSDGQNAATKVPLLGDIPLLGKFFRSTTDASNETELLVLITPYVMSTPADVARETSRLRDRSFADSSTWEGTWSDSKLLQPEPGTQADLFAPLPLDEKHQPQGILAHSGSKDIVPRVFGKSETDGTEQDPPVRTSAQDALDSPYNDVLETRENPRHRLRDSVDNKITPTETVEPEEVAPSESSPWRKIPRTSPEHSKRRVPNRNHEVMEELLRPVRKDADLPKPRRRALPDLRELDRSNPPEDELLEPSTMPDIPPENGEKKAKPPLASINKEVRTPISMMISTASEFAEDAVGNVLAFITDKSLVRHVNQGVIASVSGTDTIHPTKKESLFSRMASTLEIAKKPEVKVSPNESRERPVKAAKEPELFLERANLSTRDVSLMSPESRVAKVEHKAPPILQLAMASKRKSSARSQKQEDWKPVPATKLSKEENETPVHVKAKNTTRPLSTKPEHVPTPTISKEQLDIKSVTSGPRRFAIDQKSVADLPIRKRIDDPAPPTKRVKRSLPRRRPVEIDKETAAAQSEEPGDRAALPLRPPKDEKISRTKSSDDKQPPANTVKRSLPTPPVQADKETVPVQSDEPGGGWTVLPLKPPKDQKVSRTKSSDDKQPPANTVKRSLPTLRPVQADKETVPVQSDEPGGWTVLPLKPPKDQKVSRTKSSDDKQPPANTVKRSLPTPPVQADKETVPVQSDEPGGWTVLPLKPPKDQKVSRTKSSDDKQPPANTVKRSLPTPPVQADKETVPVQSDEPGGWTVLPLKPPKDQKVSRAKSFKEKSTENNESVARRKKTASQPKQRLPIRVKRSSQQARPTMKPNVTKVKPVQVRTPAKLKLKPRKMGEDPVKQPPNVKATLPPVVPKVNRHSSRQVIRHPIKARTAPTPDSVTAPIRKTVENGDKLVEELKSIVGPDAVKQADFPKMEHNKTTPNAMKTTTSSRDASLRLVSELPAQTPQHQDPAAEESTGINTDDTEAPPPLK